MTPKDARETQSLRRAPRKSKNQELRIADKDLFKLGKIRQVQSAISAASRDDDRSTPRGPSIVQFDRVWWMAGLQFFG
jgi:hypothetical protein